ncbi:hypothetical protein MSAN_01679500 [Mycena sanguinolenta]|uniref:Protein prenyltransferase alpha subunit repeat-containing protein 1 n=1 Tax=Mycena sanguinolenta TaxID=230812 RepID=A0A8H6XZF1_9AGAR|nr:hypothetical protein MSAN_01679500 [Mycena sanguinolenta]
MQSSLLSVEILPGGIEQWATETPEAGRPSTEFPFVYMENHLGVPKKILYQLYLSALDLLKSDNATSQLDASCVIVLANPAHATALNVRKRHIQSGTLSAHAELKFSEMVLPSSRPCSKESIQWAHRRWVGIAGSPLEVPEIPADAIEAEFKLISKCCETYPRNYHAWSHHHFVMQCIYVSLRGSHPADSPFLALFTAEFSNLRRWIESHVSDYSAIHQFCSLIARLQFLDLPQYHSTLAPLADSVVHFEHAVSLIKAFPNHESLWMYLRATIDLSPSPNADALPASAVASTAQFEGLHRDRFILWTKKRAKITGF